jgi:AraC family transcriptional regulator, ethanolamine operon transcriptional activator
MHDDVLGNFVALLAAATANPRTRWIEAPRSVARRLTAVRACENYMREHVAMTITLLDLSGVARMPTRSLINAFEAITGFSPMLYLKRLRLNGVRRALQSADKRESRIIDLAGNWGFWHMGHFAAAYRGMFGETPSQTLLRS